MDILEETVNQGYVLNVYVNVRFNTKYKRTPMKPGAAFIGVCLFTSPFAACRKGLCHFQSVAMSYVLVANGNWK